MSDLLEVVELLGNFLNANGVVDEAVQDQLLALAASECFVNDALNRNRLLDICEYIVLTYPQESGTTNDSDTIRLCADIVDNIIIIVDDFIPLFGEYQDLVRYCGSLLPSTGTDDVIAIASSLRVVTHVINICPESERACLSVFPWSVIYADCVMIVENSLDAGVLQAAVYLWYCAYRQMVEPALVVAQQVGTDGRSCDVDENILGNALREGLLCLDDTEGGSLCCWRTDGVGGRGAPDAPTLSREELNCLVATINCCTGCTSPLSVFAAVCSWPVGDAVEQAGRLLVLCARLVELLVEVVLMRNSEPTRFAVQLKQFVAASESVNMAATCCLSSLSVARSARVGEQKHDDIYLARCCSAVLASVNEFLGLLDESDVVEWVAELHLSQTNDEGATACERFALLVRNCVALRGEVAKVSARGPVAGATGVDADSFFSGLWVRFEAALSRRVR